MIGAAFRVQAEGLKNNPVTALLIFLSAIGSLYVGYVHQAIPAALLYLSLMWLFAFITDMIVQWRGVTNDFPVRNPKKESFYFLLCFALGSVFLIVRFMGIVDWPTLKPLLRLAVASLLIFAFPIALAIIMLILRYKPADLGIRLQGLLVIIPVVLISALANQLFRPHSLTWNIVMQESGGIIGLLFTGLIMAGLSEEFFRVIGQTRLGALLHNKGLGWFLTTFIWALMHTPKWYSDGKDMTEALLGALRIIPLGLTWGYITHRTKSILPSVVIHGLNFWGLQNF